MIGRLEGYSGNGFNERRAYLGNEISKRFQSEREELKNKLKQENISNKKVTKKDDKNDTLSRMNSLMRNNMLNKR